MQHQQGQVFGQFRLDSCIEWDPQSELWVAIDLRGALPTQRAIALRIWLNPEAEEEVLERARFAAQLRHGAIASVIQAGRSADGQVWCASELIEGPSLARLAEDTKRQGKGLPLATLRLVGARIAEALAHVEQRALDLGHDPDRAAPELGPSAVRVDATGAPRLIDVASPTTSVPDDELSTDSEGLALGSSLSRRSLHGLGRMLLACSGWEDAEELPAPLGSVIADCLNPAKPLSAAAVHQALADTPEREARAQEVLRRWVQWGAEPAVEELLDALPAAPRARADASSLTEVQWYRDGLAYTGLLLGVIVGGTLGLAWVIAQKAPAPPPALVPPQPVARGAELPSQSPEPLQGIVETASIGSPPPTRPSEALPPRRVARASEARVPEPRRSPPPLRPEVTPSPVPVPKDLKSAIARRLAELRQVNRDLALALSVELNETDPQDAAALSRIERRVEEGLKR